MYRIREVDGDDDDIADTLAELHRLTFFDGAPIPEFDRGRWWLAFHETAPVAFAGMVPATRTPKTGYFCRVGVLRKYCGNGLQLRLMRALEWRGPAQWMALGGVGHDRKCRFRQQFHPCRLPAVSAAMPLGVVEYAVLAKICQMMAGSARSAHTPAFYIRNTRLARWPDGHRAFLSVWPWQAVCRRAAKQKAVVANPSYAAYTWSRVSAEIHRMLFPLTRSCLHEDRPPCPGLACAVCAGAVAIGQRG